MRVTSSIITMKTETKGKLAKYSPTKLKNLPSIQRVARLSDYDRGVAVGNRWLAVHENMDMMEKEQMNA